LAKTNSEQTENASTGGFAPRLGGEGTRAKRVLLVDNHGLFREVLAVLFERYTDLGGDVQVGSIAEARRALSGRNGNGLALAVVNLDLPDEGGIELIEELRRAGIRVLGLTANRDSERLARASRAGPDEVLSTAVSCDEILDAVRRLVGG
jgi:DNA-binding NarL/FixJ family response regulator